MAIIVDFDSLDRIVNLVSKPTPTLTVKHVVNLTRQNPNDNGKDKKKLGYAFKYEMDKTRFAPKFTGLYFNSVAFIQLAGVNQLTDDKGENTKQTIKCDLHQNNFMPFIAMLDKGYDWLAGKSYSSTFILDESGRPLKIKDPLRRETCPLSQTSYISIKPSIVRDSSNVRYEGILMLTPEGELTNFTAVEFAAFREQMIHLLPNLYTATTALVNQAITYSLYSLQQNNKQEQR